MEDLYQAIVELPIGKIGIRTDQDHLLGIDFVGSEVSFIKPKTIIAKDTVEQLLCYFADPTYIFNLPLLLNVTPFQQSVLALLQKIPVGITQTYSDIAQALQSSPRAVGNACRANPLPIIIPCHRVVGENNFGGYSGQTDGNLVAIKRWLLQHESAKKDILAAVEI